jgi:hypothetical protein
MAEAPCSSCNTGCSAEGPALAGDACAQSPYAAKPPGARVVVKVRGHAAGCLSYLGTLPNDWRGQA